jgi:hypothetical protein
MKRFLCAFRFDVADLGLICIFYIYAYIFTTFK